MALNWNIAKVKDWEKLEGAERSITDAIVWATMAVGIPEITEKNVDEFYARVHLFELLVGSYRQKEGKAVYITKDDVKRRVGLYTNASRYTRNQFNKIRLERYYEEV